MVSVAASQLHHFHVSLFIGQGILGHLMTRERFTLPRVSSFDFLMACSWDLPSSESIVISAFDDLFARID
jgi:hypothetical protein